MLCRRKGVIMDRYYYQFQQDDSNPAEISEWTKSAQKPGFYIYDRKVSSVKEIAICQDQGFASTIISALNAGSLKANYQHRRS